MRKLFTSALNYFDKLNDFLAVLADICLVVLMLLITTEVVMRYLFRSPIEGAVEAQQIILIVICFLGASWVLKKDQHIVLDVVINRLSQRHLALMKTVTGFVGAIVCLITAWYGLVAGIDYTIRGIMTSGMLNFPKGPILVLIAIGFFFMFIQFLRLANVSRKSLRKASSGASEGLGSQRDMSA